jgi:cell division protein FtsQ
MQPHYLGFALLGLLMLVLAVLVIRSSERVLSHVNPQLSAVVLENDTRFVQENEIRSTLADLNHRGFFSLDVRDVQLRLEAHPWIASAEVKRVWPDRLVINLVEEAPIARWGADRLLNQQGDIFTPTPGSNLPNLPLLQGPEDGQVLMMEQFQVISALLFPHGLRVDQLSLSERGSWELILNDGIRVVAGKQDVLNRLKRFVDIYDSRIKNDIAVIEVVDLRYENGISVKHQAQDASEVAVR